MTLFSKRHYEFLAEFAGKHLTIAEQIKLAGELTKENFNFNADKFHRAAANHRRYLSEQK